MTLKLEEFRLETYDERMVLMLALHRLHTDNRDFQRKETIDTLLARLSKTQCQPGGCSYCGGPQEDYDD